MYVVKFDNMVIVCKVMIGLVDGECMSIVSGVMFGECVVIDGLDCLCEGLKILILVDKLKGVLGVYGVGVVLGVLVVFGVVGYCGGYWYGVL